jgi:hypothetical protein
VAKAESVPVEKTKKTSNINGWGTTAAATATGGRNGHTEASDGSVNADLSVPKPMGGPGKPNTTTPEHVFAAGNAACFGGALDYVAKQHKKEATKRPASPRIGVGHPGSRSRRPKPTTSETRSRRGTEWLRVIETSLRAKNETSLHLTETLLCQAGTPLRHAVTPLHNLRRR